MTPAQAPHRPLLPEEINMNPGSVLKKPLTSVALGMSILPRDEREHRLIRILFLIFFVLWLPREDLVEIEHILACPSW